MRLLFDASAITRQFMYLTDKEFGIDVKDEAGKTFHIPDVETSKERLKASLAKTLHEFSADPRDIIWVMEEGECKERTTFYPEYKAQRKLKPMPKEFWTTFTELKAWASNFIRSIGGITVQSRRSHEADDIINEIVTRFTEPTVIVSTDKDFLSCPAALFYLSGELVKPSDKFPVEYQRHIILYRSIVQGDASDNVSSCKGFGPKAWAEMVEIFGPECLDFLKELVEEERLNELQEDVGEFKKLQLIIDQADKIYAAYKVMSFLPVPAYQLKWRGGMQVDDFDEWEPEATLVTASNFQDVVEQIETMETDYVAIDFETDVPPESDAWLERTETKVDVIMSEPVGMGLKINEKNWYFSVDHKDTDNITIDQLNQILKMIDGTRVIAHNSTGFENIILYKTYGKFLPDMVDTQLMTSYVDENDYVDLKSRSLKWLDYKQTKYSQVLNGARGMRDITGQQVFDYGIDDVVTAEGLYVLYSAILQYEKTLDVFYTVEQDSAYFTSLCFLYGVDFGEDNFKELETKNNIKKAELWKELKQKLIDIEWPGTKFQLVDMINPKTVKQIFKTIYEEDLVTRVRKTSSLIEAVRKAGGTELADTLSIEDRSKKFLALNALYKKHWTPEPIFNVRSPLQIKKLLYDVLKAPVRVRNKPTEIMKKKGQVGNPATDEDAIKNAIAFADTKEPELLQLLHDYKATLTLESLFYSKYPAMVHWHTGKLHCRMQQSITTTRRFAHAGPNLAQLPKKKGRENRKMLVPPGDDWVIASFDFDSQELKLQAWATQDPAFLSCYTGPKEDRKDVHSMTGFNIAKKQKQPWKSYEDFLEDLKSESGPFRQKGKTVNFSTSYLCGDKKLAHMLCITEEEAAAFKQAKSAAFPTVDKAVRLYIKKCRRRKYSRTFLGARRHLHSHKHFGSRDDYVLDSTGRLAWSYRIQGSAAEQTKLAMARSYRAGFIHPDRCRPITTIHDELVFAIHREYLDDIVPQAVNCVCAKYDSMELENTTTPAVGPNFGELEELIIPF